MTEGWAEAEKTDGTLIGVGSDADEEGNYLLFEKPPAAKMVA